MKKGRIIAAAAAIALIGFGGSPAVAQDRPLDQLKPLRSQGGPISPMFDGWYRNADGSFTLSFGFINLNDGQAPDIPIGENNFIEPAQFNGMQPTYFPDIRYPGFGGRHERGVFAVTVPAEMEGEDVTWTLRFNGRTFSIPGRIEALEYELSHSPATEGSLPPSVRVGNSEISQGREGVVGERLQARVGVPLTLNAWIRDEGNRERVRTNLTFIKHQGPGDVEFSDDDFRFDEGEGEASPTATFSAPGEYMIRVRADNFGAGDSSFSNQCCWSNAYIPVSVSP